MNPELLTMNPELKKKWVDALRSGEYAQGKSYLRSRHSYCCLGVLADVIIKETDQYYWLRDYNSSVVESYSFINKKDGCTVGLCKFSPSFRRNYLNSLEQDKLIELNDNEDLSFNEIADYIETNIQTGTVNNQTT